MVSLIFLIYKIRLDYKILQLPSENNILQVQMFSFNSYFTSDT